MYEFAELWRTEEEHRKDGRWTQSRIPTVQLELQRDGDSQRQQESVLRMMAPVYLRSTMSPQVPFTWCFVTVVGVLCFKSYGGFSGSDCRVVVGFLGFGVLSWYGASLSCHIASGVFFSSSVSVLLCVYTRVQLRRPRTVALGTLMQAKASLCALDWVCQSCKVRIPSDVTGTPTFKAISETRWFSEGAKLVM
ncbi:hypothetical protein DY000_02053908 [Brassica cretica]|uniref:Transmembrane protein n=1 Tax=Brassica cretica TaxID=69181 RepID=A0ABQ7AIX9_BRACR|nr:hypothetical protein DY000_02053908 [Brassica cretica]